MRIADLTLRNSFALQNLKILTVQMLKTQKANKENQKEKTNKEFLFFKNSNFQIFYML